MRWASGNLGFGEKLCDLDFPDSPYMMKFWSLRAELQIRVSDSFLAFLMTKI
jgi:hypothetical protein